MLKTILQAAALAAAVLASVPGHASAAERAYGRADERAAVRVSYGDLDLSNPAGVQALDRRLARAVNAACPSADGVREMSRLRTIALCHKAKHAEVAPLRQTALAAAASRNRSLASAR